MPFEFEFDSSEATAELQQITLPPPRARPPKRTARSDAGRLLGRGGALARRRLTLLREDIPLWQRQRRALAVVLLLVLLVVSVTRGGGHQGATHATASGAAVQPQPAGGVKGAEVMQIRLAPGTILKPGAGGPDVRSLQEALRRLGLTAAKTDGVYGRKTKKAVKKFQKQAGLTPDGVAGPKTIAALNRALASLP